MTGPLDEWAAGRASELLARAEEEAVAELRAALLRAALTARGDAPAHSAPPAAPPAPPVETPAPEPGEAFWAYGVARTGADLDFETPGVHPEGAVERIEDGGLVLLFSRVPLAEFGEEPLRRNLNDLPWLERVARAHERVLESALERATIVPLRLCTLFAGQEGARRMLAERRPVLEDALARLDGRVEWGVKLLVDRAALDAAVRSQEGVEAEAGAAGGGAAYMLARREERRLREAADRVAAGLAEDVHARLQERADDARLRPAQSRELSQHEGDMVLNGAYLVAREEGLRWRALVAELQELHGALGARLELAGPFPPFNFVPEAEA